MMEKESTVPEHNAPRLPPLDYKPSSLEEIALESLLKASKTPQGRSLLASRGAVPALLRCLPTQPVPLFRLLRNLCAGEIVNQNSFIKANGPDVIASIILQSPSVPPAPLEIVRMGLQLLGNVVVAGEEHQNVVWGRFFPDGFLELARVRNVGVCDPLCMVLYTCCGSAKVGSFGRLEELCRVGRGLPVVAEIMKTAESAGYEGDWFVMLTSRICFKERYFSLLFRELEFSNTAENYTDLERRYTSFTREQAFLLGLLSDVLSEELYKDVIANDFALSILQILKGACGVVDFTSRGVSPLPTGSPAIDVLGYSLVILRDACVFLDNSSPTCQGFIDSLLSSGLCQFLLDLLRGLEPPSIIRKSLAGGFHDQGLPSMVSGSWKVCPYMGFRRDIVSVIGNCMFERKHVQDEIRQRDGILLLLQQCVIDKDNPFLREWGMLTISYLLKNNAENQQEVAELELLGAVDTPQISELGLKLELDKEARRVKLVNVPQGGGDSNKGHWGTNPSRSVTI